MSDWTPARIERLKKLHDDGFTGSQIAAQIGGITRNAVIGKIHRLKLPTRGKPRGSKPKPPRVSKPPRKPSPIPELPLRQRAVIPPMRQPANPVRLLDRNPHTQCPFPLWQDYPGEDALVCGAQKLEGGNYCPEHDELCCPGRPKRRAA